MILHELPGGHRAASTRTAGVCVGGGAASRPTWCLQASFLGEADCVQAGPLEKPKATPSAVIHQLCAKAQGRVFTVWC